jgi:hypothetical protein
MVTRTIYKEIEVTVDVDDFTNAELLEELNSRGIVNFDSVTNMIDGIYQKQRLGLNYDKELSDLIYKTLGRIV